MAIEQPLLNNPPAFVLLAIMIGLAAYLRQLGEHRSSQIDEIEGGRDKNYPLGEFHSTEKIKDLRRSRERLNQVAPPAILFTIAIGFRLLALAYVRFRAPDDPQLYAGFFRTFDLVIAVVLFFLLVVLYVMHRAARRSDEKMRSLVEAWRARPKVEIK
jgi:hypothetical protein